MTADSSERIPLTEEVCWPLAPADANTFTGRAFSGLLAGAEEEDPVRLYFVRFEAGGCTHWHTHSGAQILLVLSGRCLYQREGEPVREIGPGKSVRFRPGERHWHGAGEGAGAEHIAINLDNARTEWMGPVDRTAIETR